MCKFLLRLTDLTQLFDRILFIWMFFLNKKIRKRLSILWITNIVNFEVSLHLERELMTEFCFILQYIFEYALKNA